MPPIKVSSSDLQLLKKEIETLGDFVENERLQNKAEIDHLKFEIECIKRTLSALIPEFGDKYEKTYSEFIQEYDAKAA